MATRIPLQRLSVGDNTVSVSFTPDSDSVSLAASSIQFGSATSQVRFLVKDSSGRVIGSAFIVGTNSARLILNGVGEAITLEIECHLGSATVTATESTGGAVSSDDIADGSVGSDEIADGAVESVDIADEAVTNDHIEDASISGEKFADDTVEFWHLAESASGLGHDTSVAVPDPGDGLTIASRSIDGGNFFMNLTSGGAPETRVMGSGKHTGQTAVLRHSSGAGNIAIDTDVEGWDGNGGTVTATLPTSAIMVVVCVGGTNWRALASKGVTFA